MSPYMLPPKKLLLACTQDYPVKQAGSRRKLGSGPPKPTQEEEGGVAATLEQKRKQRFQFMRCLYEMSRGSERVLLYDHEVGDTIGLGRMEAESARQYLAERGLVRVVMGHIISISQAGADELEAALEQPEQATSHFPPAQGIAWMPVTAQPSIAQDAIGKPPVNQASIEPLQEAPTTSIQEESVKPLPAHPSPAHPVPANPLPADIVQNDSDERLQEAPIKPLPAHIVQNDSDELAALELQRICEAIGLDPKEITGELAPHHNRPVSDPVDRLAPEPALPPESALHRYEEQEPRDVSTPADNGSLRPQPDSSSSFSFNETDLDVILESLRLKLPKLGFAPDDLAEAEAEIDTVRAQLASPKPKLHILAASLKTLSSLLENASWSWTSDTRESLVAIRDFQERLSA
jgi:hypothetical protein